MIGIIRRITVARGSPRVIITGTEGETGIPTRHQEIATSRLNSGIGIVSATKISITLRPNRIHYVDFLKGLSRTPPLTQPRMDSRCLDGSFLRFQSVVLEDHHLTSNQRVSIARLKSSLRITTVTPTSQSAVTCPRTTSLTTTNSAQRPRHIRLLGSCHPRHQRW